MRMRRSLNDGNLPAEDQRLISDIDAAIIDPNAMDEEQAPIGRFVRHLVMSQPDVDGALRQRLESETIRLLERRQGAERRSHMSIRQWLAGGFAAQRVRYGVAAAIVLAVSFVAAGSVVAQMRPRRVIAPQEVATPPAFQIVNPDPIPTERRWIGLDELRSRLGAPLVLPTSLPDGCTEQERFFLDGPKVAYVVYSCMTVAVQAGSAAALPYVAPGTTQQVVINGQPATYILGSWTQQDGSVATPAWVQGPQTLIFERDGMLIRIHTYPGDLALPQGDGRRIRIPNIWQLGRDDLIRIAQSFTPIP